MLFNIFPLWHQSTYSNYLLYFAIKFKTGFMPRTYSQFHFEQGKVCFKLTAHKVPCPHFQFLTRRQKKSIIFWFCTRQLLNSSLVYLAMILGRFMIIVY